MKYFKALIYWICFSTIQISFADDVTILGPQSDEDTSHSYFSSLVSLAIDKTRDQGKYKRVVVLKSIQTTQGRSIILLEKDFVNLFWSGTSITREEKLIPVRIPIFKGLLGYRMFIVRRDNIAEFNNISEENLKQKVACQGQHWPDSDILETNGYKVLRVARFDLMFKMLMLKRCDYFPRAIYEGYGEFERAKIAYPELEVYDETLLHYPFPIYFFTNNKHPELAKQVYQGLMLALADGSLDALMKSYTSTLNIFPLDKWKSKRYIHLKNNYLPDITEIEDSPLWLKLYPSAL